MVDFEKSEGAGDPPVWCCGEWSTLKHASAFTPNFIALSEALWAYVWLPKIGSYHQAAAWLTTYNHGPCQQQLPCGHWLLQVKWYEHTHGTPPEKWAPRIRL